jgi:hypothetical protein
MPHGVAVWILSDTVKASNVVVEPIDTALGLDSCARRWQWFDDRDGCGVADPFPKLEPASPSRLGQELHRKGMLPFAERHTKGFFTNRRVALARQAVMDSVVARQCVMADAIPQVRNEPIQLLGL